MKQVDVTLSQITKGEYFLLPEAIEYTNWPESLIRGIHTQLQLPLYRLQGKYIVVSKANIDLISQTLKRD